MTKTSARPREFPHTYLSDDYRLALEQAVRGDAARGRAAARFGERQHRVASFDLLSGEKIYAVFAADCTMCLFKHDPGAPNLRSAIVLERGHVPHIATFTTRFVDLHEPLTIDHRLTLVACNCGACGLPLHPPGFDHLTLDFF